MGGCQNYGPFLGTLPYYNRDPKRDHSFDNHPYVKKGGLSEMRSSESEVIGESLFAWHLEK